MTNELKEYRELTAIDTFGGVLYTEASCDTLDQILEWSKFIKIWDKRIAVHQIKEYYPHKINGIESYILSLDTETQKRVREREKQKIARIGKWWETIRQIELFLNDDL